MKRECIQGVLIIVLLLTVFTLVSQAGTPGEGWFHITSLRSGKCLEVAVWDEGQMVALDQGANIRQWECVGGENQLWRFESVGGDLYALYNQRSGMCLEVAKWDQGQMVGRDQGANIRQWDYVGGDNQKWRLIELPSGYYRIESAFSGMVLDVAQGSRSDGGNIHQWEWRGSDNQLWAIEGIGQSQPSASAMPFSDNLEGGGGKWILEQGWSVGSWQGDRCLVGTQHAFATMSAADHWTDYTLTANVALPNKGWLHINVHTDWTGPGRYYVGVSNHTVRLTREWPIGTHKELARSEILHLDTCCPWNEVTLLVGKTRIRVYVNGVSYIDHTDTTKADGVLQEGGISFESQGTAVYVDDVRVVSGYEIPELRCEVAQMWIAGVEIPNANVDGLNDRAEWRLRFEGYVSGMGFASIGSHLQWSGAWSSNNVASGWHFPLDWYWDIDLDDIGSYRLKIDGYEYDGNGSDPLVAAAVAFHASLHATAASGGLIPPLDPISAAAVAFFASLNDNDVLPTLTIEFDRDENFGLSWIPYASTAGAGYKFTYILEYEVKCKQWDCP